IILFKPKKVDNPIKFFLHGFIFLPPSLRRRRRFEKFPGDDDEQHKQAVIHPFNFNPFDYSSLQSQVSWHKP
ncbi:hypothetical protein AKJ16_DCAP18073, partial [Drosera capensis]